VQAQASERHLRVRLEGTRVHEGSAFILLADDLQEARKGAQRVHVFCVLENSLLEVPVRVAIATHQRRWDACARARAHAHTHTGRQEGARGSSVGPLYPAVAPLRPVQTRGVPARSVPAPATLPAALAVSPWPHATCPPAVSRARPTRPVPPPALLPVNLRRQPELRHDAEREAPPPGAPRRRKRPPRGAPQLQGAHQHAAVPGKALHPHHTRRCQRQKPRRAPAGEASPRKSHVQFFGQQKKMWGPCQLLQDRALRLTCHKLTARRPRMMMRTTVAGG